MALKFKKPDATARLSVSLPRSMRRKLLIVQSDAASGEEPVQVTISEILEKFVNTYWESDKDLAKLEKELTKAASKAIEEQLDAQEGKVPESAGEGKPAEKPADLVKAAPAATPVAPLPSVPGTTTYSAPRI